MWAQSSSSQRLIAPSMSVLAVVFIKQSSALMYADFSVLVMLFHAFRCVFVVQVVFHEAAAAARPDVARTVNKERRVTVILAEF